MPSESETVPPESTELPTEPTVPTEPTLTETPEPTDGAGVPGVDPDPGAGGGLAYTGASIGTAPGRW